ncbi:MAG: hypothetical protein Q8O67_09280 [Deltaproteobacteria bacterium]|nr:hypothetical protein [Deltaproteobacteria bacterium]
MKTLGALPEPGAVFPEFTLVASDDAVVTDADFDGRRKVFFLCAGPEHEATAQLIEQAAAVVDEHDNTVLIPVSRTAPVEWRRFLRATRLEGIAPLSVGVDVVVPFPVLASGALAPALVFVNEQDEVRAVQSATDGDSLAGLDVKKLLG